MVIRYYRLFQTGGINMQSCGKLVLIEIQKLVLGMGTDLTLMDESIGKEKASD